jgi:putative transposase
VAKSGAEAEADDVVWALAKRRADVIRTLLATGGTSLDPTAVRAATAELGVGRTTLYRFISQFRAAEVTSTLLPSRRGRPAGARSLDAEREKLIAEEIETYYLRAERPRLSDLVERIAGRCHQVRVPVPNWRTISSRVRGVDAARVARKRHDTSALQNLIAVPGEFVAARPLDVVQIDHTPMDVFVVDAENRLGMTRPWLTLAIDVHTRMVVGLHLSLDAPSVSSVGLCLLSAVFDKSAMLEALGIDVAWPTMGLPRTIHVDNGAEFHSEAFVRGCEEHGVHVDWRPPGAPRYGGHIERLIGTQMGAVHALTGSTGSSVANRQSRDAQSRAIMTMR